MTRGVDVQRRRIVDAMVLVVGEHGFARTTVAGVCARAKVSRVAFCEQFDGLEDCFLTVLDEGHRRTVMLVSDAFEREESWLDGVRGALVALLSSFDSDPIRARVLLVEAIAAGSWARECREHHIASLTSLIEERWGAPEDGHLHPLVTAGVMASLLGVLHSHLVIERDGPLTGLLGPLMGLVTAPYLNPTGVAREIERGDVVARELLTRREHERPGPPIDVEIPEFLLDPRAHRARACLLYLAEHLGVSNRQVARAVGISGDTHISMLLARLCDAALVEKHSGPPGAPNAWFPSPEGRQVAHALRFCASSQDDTATGRVLECEHVNLDT